MIYIYRRQPSVSAVRLAEALRARGLGAKKVRSLRRVREGDTVIAWGEGSIPSKYNELRLLAEAGVPAVEASRTPVDGWLPRSSNHTGGIDLIYPEISRADYCVRQEQVVREFRVHVWGGVSIRAGIKVPRVPNPHPWVRSYEGGWKLDYGVACQDYIRQRYRETAKSAVQALDLHFGAVDIGVREDGTDIVFEVNRAPGLEGRTVEVYADKIAAWVAESGM